MAPAPCANLVADTPNIQALLLRLHQRLQLLDVLFDALADNGEGIGLGFVAGLGQLADFSVAFPDCAAFCISDCSSVNVVRRISACFSPRACIPLSAVWLAAFNASKSLLRASMMAAISTPGTLNCSIILVKLASILVGLNASFGWVDCAMVILLS